MPSFTRFALPFILVFALQSAHAQSVIGRQWETNVSLTQADMDLIRTTLAQQVHSKTVGTSASWNNPTSGNSGTLTLLKITQRQGQRCEQIDYRIRPPEKGTPSDHYTLTSCLQPDGSWKLSP